MMNNKEFEFISSRQNEKIKEFSKLADPKYRREYGLFLAEGVKLAEEAVESGAAKYLLILDSAAEDCAVKSVLDKSQNKVPDRRESVGNSVFVMRVFVREPQLTLICGSFRTGSPDPWR